MFTGRRNVRNDSAADVFQGQMKHLIRTPLLCAALLAALVTAPSAAFGAAAKPAAKVVLAAKLATCPAPGDTAGLVNFVASMPALPGTAPGSRMAMRFELQQQGEGRPWLPVVGIPSFDRWEQSQPSRPGFVVTKKVKGLALGGTYRAVVRFRWLDPKGVVVKTARRVTAVCAQPDMRPDLVVGPKPQIAKGSRPDLVVYTWNVRNAGKGAAVPSSVTVEVNGTVQPAQRIEEIGPGGTISVVFQAPRCTPGTFVRFTVDSDGEIGEANEHNNVLERRCATAASTPAA